MKKYAPFALYLFATFLVVCLAAYFKEKKERMTMPNLVAYAMKEAEQHDGRLALPGGFSVTSTGRVDSPDIILQTGRPQWFTLEGTEDLVSYAVVSVASLPDLTKGKRVKAAVTFAGAVMANSLGRAIGAAKPIKQYEFEQAVGDKPFQFRLALKAFSEQHDTTAYERMYDTAED